MISKILNAVTTVLVIAVVLFAVLLVGVRLTGIQVFAVVSGSMEPEYPVGSLIYVKETDPSQVKVGDVITFVLPNETPATHRVVSIDEKNEFFYTKGDANDIADTEPVFFKNLIGMPVFKIPLLGYVASYIQNPPGTYVAVAGAALLIIMVFIPDLLKSNTRSRKRYGSSDDAGE